MARAGNSKTERGDNVGKHAYLIIAHNKFEHLGMAQRRPERIGIKVRHMRIDVHINVVLLKIQHLAQHFELLFAERTRVNWGGYSQIQAELNLLKAAANSGEDYSYYHLLSGADLPLRPAQEIWGFFEQRGTEFIHFSAHDFAMEERTQERAKCYHLLQEKVGRPTGWLYYMERGLVEMQKLLRVDRLKRNGMERLYCGSQWFSITGALAKYVLSKEDWIKSAFSYGCCVDECFLQTLVMQSAFAGNLSMPPEADDYHANMRWIDWKRGNPYTFEDGDYEELIASDYLFARKFDMDQYPKVCKALYKNCVKK